MLFIDNETTPVVNVHLAQTFQRFIVDFIHENDAVLDQRWPIYGMNASFLNITAHGFEDDLVGEEQVTRCEFLNQVFADPENGI